jgi:hypothetical protein
MSGPLTDRLNEWARVRVLNPAKIAAARRRTSGSQHPNETYALFNAN